MSIPTMKRCVFGATLGKNGSKIVLRGPRNDDASAFFGTLPASRWDSLISAWSIDAVPSAAWRLLNESPVAIEADSDVLALAAEFAAALAGGGQGQPAIRKTDGWGHQVDAYHFAQGKSGAYISHGMGCGKTWTAVNLVVNRKAKKTIILCPVSVLGVWRREFEKHAGAPVDVCVLDSGTVAAKANKADAFLKRCDIQGIPAAIVINYESAWRGVFAEWSLKQDWDVAIADESHRLKSHDAAVSKYASSLGRAAKFRIALSGTPMPHSPLDAFGQFRFLDRGIFGTWFHHFRNRYAKMNQMFPGKVDSWLNQDELKARLGLIMHRVTSEDVLDLPPVNHETRLIHLSSSAMKAYRSLEENLIADLGPGIVTATNALTRLLRLQQMTSGYAVDDETGVEKELDDGKRLALHDLLEDVGPQEPVVVFCRFRHDLQTVEACAADLKRAYGEISGRKKTGLNELGCMVEGVQVMGVQIQSGGVGIDLTRARYAVYYSLGFSLGDYLQSLARVHRPGQNRPVFYYHLLAAHTVDQSVYKALENRQEVVESVLSAIGKL